MDNFEGLIRVKNGKEALVIASPYLILPRSIVGNLPEDWKIYPATVFPNRPLEVAMAALCNLYFSDNKFRLYWQTEGGLAHQGYLAYVVAEFWLEESDSRCDLPRIPRQPKEARKLIVAEAELWSLLLRILERMHTFGRITQNPAIPLFSLINEAALVLIPITNSNNTRVRDEKRTIQTQNRQLQALINPFDPAKYPFTHRLAENAIDLALTHDRFRKKFWNPFVKKRMEIVSLGFRKGVRKFDLEGNFSGSGKRVSEISNPETNT